MTLAQQTSTVKREYFDDLAAMSSEDFRAEQARLARVIKKPRPARQVEPLPALELDDTPLTDPYDARYAKHATGVDFGYNEMLERTNHAGQVTRIDLIILPTGEHVKRTWLASWRPGQPCHKAERLCDGWTMEKAADYLAAQGWTVRRGRTWARAWRCGLRPVVVGAKLNRLRDQNVSLANKLIDLRFDDLDPEMPNG